MKPLNTHAAELISIGPVYSLTMELRKFVGGCWLPGLYFNNSFFREIDEKTFFEFYQVVIDRILSRYGRRMSAATLKQDPDTIVGFSIWEERPEGNILHWVYVRPEWRRNGIAANLIPPNVVTVTHLTDVTVNRKPKNWKFNPFL